jgi:ferric-dicitrate binding protein FerR (iron transport regulator)
MPEDRIQYLLKKKLSGRCSLSEMEEFARLVESMNDKDLKDELYKQWSLFSTEVFIDEERSRRTLESILEDKGRLRVVHTGRRKEKVLRLRLVAAAASLIILAAIGKVAYQLLQPAPAPAVVIMAAQVPPDEVTDYNRYIVLPDGSTIILKAGSTLDSPAQFNGPTREVSLNGEAYFDIARDESKPFIIHTGKLKTIVLGTAFNIKAWEHEKQVTVSVTRGKVRVEDNEMTLAVLTANQQMLYDELQSQAEQKDIAAEEIVTDWTREDLVFNGEPLESIAHTLSRHFGVNISISDAGLAGTVIVSSFSGTESLENILEVLCKINGDARYTINGKDILLKSK